MHDSVAALGGGHDEWLQAVSRAQKVRPSVLLDPIVEPFLGTVEAIPTGGGDATASPTDGVPVELQAILGVGENCHDRSSYRWYSSIKENIAYLIRRNPTPSLLIAFSIGWLLRRRQN